MINWTAPNEEQTNGRLIREEKETLCMECVNEFIAEAGKEALGTELEDIVLIKSCDKHSTKRV